MRLIVGLGNPGQAYSAHRHNVGFQAVDALSTAFSFGDYRSKWHAQVCDGMIAMQKIILAKPQTYMNKSGLAVHAICDFYDIPPEDCLILHDELDIEAGELRVKFAGGHAGHNGLRDIDRHIGKNYWRARIGVGHPGHKDAVSDYVLSPPSKADAQEIAYSLDDIVATIETFAKEGGQAFQQALSARKSVQAS